MNERFDCLNQSSCPNWIQSLSNHLCCLKHFYAFWSEQLSNAIISTNAAYCMPFIDLLNGVELSLMTSIILSIAHCSKKTDRKPHLWNKIIRPNATFISEWSCFAKTVSEQCVVMIFRLIKSSINMMRLGNFGDIS